MATPCRKGPRKTLACCATTLPACARQSSGRYRRVLEEGKPLPSLILIDGGIGQLHAAAAALDKLEIINQPLASIAKKEEILYVLGREDEPDCPRPSLAGAAPDPADSRRNAPVRNHFSPAATLQPAPAHIPNRNSWRWRAHGGAAVAPLRQCGAAAPIEPRGTCQGAAAQSRPESLRCAAWSHRCGGSSRTPFRVTTCFYAVISGVLVLRYHNPPATLR